MFADMLIVWKFLTGGNYYWQRNHILGINMWSWWSEQKQNSWGQNIAFAFQSVMLLFNQMLATLRYSSVACCKCSLLNHSLMYLLNIYWSPAMSKAMSLFHSRFSLQLQAPAMPFPLLNAILIINYQDCLTLALPLDHKEASIGKKNYSVK